jgi:hypothetical protein
MLGNERCTRRRACFPPPEDTGVQAASKFTKLGGGGSHKRTRLTVSFPCYPGKYREFLLIPPGKSNQVPFLLHKSTSCGEIP